ncbi:MAG: 1-acyl-sn-glycerol-3-phosphate acyltransferase [Pseudomonadota bacterium]
MIRSTIFTIWFYSFSFLIAMTCWLIAMVSTRTVMWYVLKFWGRACVFMVRLVLGSRIEVRGLEHYDPSRPQLIVSKHQSELDIVMLGAAFWDVTAIAMAELTKLPFFGTILRTIDAVTIAVDAGPQGRTQQAIDGAKRVRDSGRTLVVYPEGELMKLGAKERYRGGIGHIYTHTEIEVIPVAASLGVIWPQRQWRKFSGVTGVMELLEPIQPGQDFDTFMATLEERIETNTMRLIEETASGQELEDARDRFRRGANNEVEKAER